MPRKVHTEKIALLLRVIPPDSLEAFSQHPAPENGIKFGSVESTVVLNLIRVGRMENQIFSAFFVWFSGAVFRSIFATEARGRILGSQAVGGSMFGRVCSITDLGRGEKSKFPNVLCCAD
jgi:hypothetical protein